MAQKEPIPIQLNKYMFILYTSFAMMMVNMQTWAEAGIIVGTYKDGYPGQFDLYSLWYLANRLLAQMSILLEIWAGKK